MSWRCGSTSNAGLISNLWKTGLITTPRVREAFEKVDRGDFCKINPYEDSPQRIGWDATISAPHIHANAVETLKDFLKPGSKVLDIGSGSGYLCAVFAHLVVCSNSLLPLSLPSLFPPPPTIPPDDISFFKSIYDMLINCPISGFLFRFFLWFLL